MELSTIFLVSMLSLFAMAGADFAVVFVIFKNNFRFLPDISFANCWVIIGLMHLLMALRTSFFGIGMSNFDEALAYVVQFLLIFVVIALGCYLVIISFQNRFAKFFFGVIIFLITVSFLTLFVNFGLVGPIVSAWGSEYTAAPQANMVLIFAIVLALGMLLYSIIKILRQNKKERDLKRLFANISLFLFLFFSIFEQLGNDGWEVLLVRVLILGSTLMAYTTYEMEKYKYA